MTTTLLDRITKDGRIGKTQDKVLAKEYGVRQEEIGAVRRMLGIKPYNETVRRGRNAVGAAVEYAKSVFATTKDREKAVSDTAKHFGINPKTVKSYLYWAASAGTDVPFGLTSGAKLGRKPNSKTNPYASLAMDSRIAQLEDMVLKVAVSNTELLATLRQNGVIK